MKGRMTWEGTKDVIQLWRLYLSSLSTKPANLSMLESLNPLSSPLTYFTINTLADKLRLPINLTQKVKNSAVARKSLPDGQTLNYLWAESCTIYLMVTEIYLNQLYGEKPTGIVFDVGAHCGIYTLFARTRAKMLYAFEPNPETFRFLNQNTAGCQNVKSCNIALAEKSEILQFHDADLSMNCSTIKSQSGVKDSGYLVIARCLDDLLDFYELERVDFVKIDAEGSELEILKGGEKSLRSQKIKALAVASYHYAQEVTEVQKLLAKFGYRSHMENKSELIVFGKS